MVTPEEIKTVIDALGSSTMTTTELLNKLDPGSASLGYYEQRCAKIKMFRRLLYLEQHGLVRCTEHNRGSKSNKWEAVA